MTNSVVREIMNEAQRVNNRIRNNIQPGETRFNAEQRYLAGARTRMDDWMQNSNNNNNLNNGNNSRIKWENKRVNNLPNANIISFNNFKNGDKAVQYKVGKFNQYMTLNSFRGLLKKNSRLNPTQAYNSDPSKFMFVNPLNPGNRVKREDIKFVTLNKIKPTTEKSASLNNKEKLIKKKEKLRKKIVKMEALLKNARKNKA
jgi:hypothetical protein